MASKDPYLQARIYRFDIWQNDTREALVRPGVKAKLGELGARLYALNENAFLPNVRDSMVCVPRNQRDTDNVAVLPHYGKDDLLPDKTLLQPIPSRREAIRSAMAQIGLKHSRRAVSKYIDDTIATLPEESRRELVNPELVHAAYLTGDNEHNIFVPSRTVIAFKHEFLPPYTGMRGGIMAHELTHSHDHKQLIAKSDIVDRVRAELRGSYVGSVIAEDAIKTGELDRKTYESSDPGTNTMQAIIEECGINPDELLRPQTGPMTNEDHAAFSMLFVHGLIES